METKIQNKKSAVDLTDLAISLVVLGIIVSIGATILINTRDSRLTSLPTYSVVNESVTADDGGTALTTRWFNGVTQIVNSTGGEVVPATNYSTTTDVSGIGTLTFDTNSPYNATAVKTTYSVYNVSQADFVLAENAAIGIGEFGNWFKIIVIVGIAAVVLSLIFLAFGNRGGQSIGSY